MKTLLSPITDWDLWAPRLGSADDVCLEIPEDMDQVTRKILNVQISLPMEEVCSQGTLPLIMGTEIYIPSHFPYEISLFVRKSVENSNQINQENCWVPDY